ncbi:MAG: hypothetical protein H7Z41_14540 [Cytophagales bacterium]|nr:hypothetical protein [Armatimonadota bacterium]
MKGNSKNHDGHRADPVEKDGIGMIPATSAVPVSPVVVITDEQITAYLNGIGGPDTERRVLAAALQYPSVRRRMEAHRLLDRLVTDSGGAQDAVQTPETVDRPSRLGEAMRRAVETMCQESAPPAEAASAALVHRSLLAELESLLQTTGKRTGGGLWNLPSPESVRELWESLAQPVTRALIAGRHALALPCLAPAAAASAASLQMRRETVTTADGVRIEFQQLPGGGSNRLRVVVDASGLSQEVRDLGYNVAFLTLEDNSASMTPQSPELEAGTLMESAEAVLTDSPPDRHILVIVLNAEARGFTDFTVGSSSLAVSGVMPAPRGVCRLTGITLSRVAIGGGAAADEGRIASV